MNEREIKLTDQEIEIVLAGLGEVAAKFSLPVINKIQVQLMAPQEAKGEPVAEEQAREV